MSTLYHKEDKNMKKLFHINIQVKNTEAYSLLNSNSQANVIASNLVSKLGLEVHDHPSPYPLGWVNKEANIKVKKQRNIKFSISAYFIDEVELDVVPLTCVV
jgi:hypothetical protein